jgi:hypothetical protein
MTDGVNNRCLRCKPAGRLRRQRWCRDCFTAYQRERRQQKREAAAATAQHQQVLIELVRRLYTLDTGTLRRLLADQNGPLPPPPDDDLAALLAAMMCEEPAMLEVLARQWSANRSRRPLMTWTPS